MTEPPVLHHEDQITLEASAEQVWDAIKDFDAIHTWHPGAVSTEMLVGENGQPLAVREFHEIRGAIARVDTSASIAIRWTSSCSSGWLPVVRSK